MTISVPAHIDRLRAHADVLLSAYGALDLPMDFIGITRAARALIAIDRLIKAIDAPAKPVKAVKPAPAPAIAPAVLRVPAQTPVFREPVLTDLPDYAAITREARDLGRQVRALTKG